MDLEEDFLYDGEDSGHEIENDDEDFIGMEMEAEPSCTPDKRDVEDYPCEVLTPEQIVQHMVDCIKEVNAIVEVIFLFTLFRHRFELFALPGGKKPLKTNGS